MFHLPGALSPFQQSYGMQIISIFMYLFFKQNQWGGGGKYIHFSVAALFESDPKF